jgi:hypothetical protein
MFSDAVHTKHSGGTMPRPTRLAGLAAIALGATVLTSLPAVAASSATAPGSRTGGVFVETDGVTNNQVLAYARNTDGTLARSEKVT